MLSAGGARSFSCSVLSATVSCPGQHKPEEVVRSVPKKVTNDMNEVLCAPFTASEVEKALFAMKPNKSPGPDGFTTGFYQKHWSMVKEDVCKAVLEFLNGGEMLEIVNSTVLVLIPKVKIPKSSHNSVQLHSVMCCTRFVRRCFPTD